MTGKVLVAGSGVIGLRTALELLRRKVPVALRSAHHPLHPSTCSMGAGGLWMPYSCDDPRVGGWAKTTLDELLLETMKAPSSNSRMSADGSDKGIEIVPAVYFHQDNHINGVDFNSHTLPDWTEDSRLNFQHMTVEMLHWQNLIHKLRIPPLEVLEEAGYKYCWMFQTPIVDCPRMLKHMLDEVINHELTDSVGSDVFDSMEDMLETARRIDCDAVINCTGMGAASICNDDQLIGARGVLHQYDRSTCARLFNCDDEDFKDAALFATDGAWGSDNEPCYLIPRGERLVVGGSNLSGDTELGIREEEKKKLVANAKLLGLDSDNAQYTSEWTGFRPYRSKVRLELDEKYTEDGMRVVHNYGHGGSGWTCFSGAAINAVELCLDNKQ